jgi:hypothetical protein
LLPFLGQRQKLECVSTKASLACSNLAKSS